MVTRNRQRQRQATRLRAAEALEQRRVLAAVLSMQGPTEAVFEGERAEYTLRLSERSARAETVFITTQPGSATLGVDYAAMSRQQVIFAPGETVKRLSISTLAEAVPRTEGAETFSITATPANPRLSPPLTVGVIIVDKVPKPTISAANIVVTEGDSGVTPATFTIALSSAYPRVVTVAYATRDESAKVADNDYAAVTGQLTFLPGQTSQTVTVNVNGDRIAETDEVFSLFLSAPTNATVGRSSAICTIVNDEPDPLGFQVALKFLDSPTGPVPQSVRTVAQQAVNRWARIITGDLPAETVNGFRIDDFEMSIQMGLLNRAPSDGPDGILANAGPTAYRDNGAGLPVTGITGIDPADIANPALLLDTITHEMGHAFGFIRGATVFGRWVVGDTFTGPNALREFNSTFTATASAVPLQVNGGHWDEATFGDELMSPVTTGAPEYISRITIGALQDMGYTVDYAAAEPYVHPRTFAPQVVATTGVTTVSTFPSGGTKPLRSTKSPLPAAPAAPAVVVVRPVATNTIPFVAGSGWKGGTAAPSKDVPFKANGGATLLTQSGVKIG